ncbi:MAG TPA: hypothetical protein VL984_04720 [Acidimicrobiales bacterium]|nr:hypothetical protein [Acidimicrobiales bacterium]
MGRGSQDATSAKDAAVVPICGIVRGAIGPQLAAACTRILRDGGSVRSLG